MKRIETIAHLEEAYPLLKNDTFNKRYLLVDTMEKICKELPLFFNLKKEGESVNKIPIHSLCFGKGTTKILMWSQMHGNETTTTKAVFDVLKTFEKAKEQDLLQKILASCTIKILPILNPDGAKIYTRENANGVDLNRDAKTLSQPESKILDKVFRNFNPDFCFNLHDQRTIYSVGNSNHPATISFLSPASNEEKDIHASRKISMQLIAGITDYLQKYIPSQIGRYDDTFNPNCVGDKFQSFHVPTLLFEAGHFPGDYQREKTRKLIYFGLMKALELISTGDYLSFTVSKYAKIPPNKKMFFDILIRNVLIQEELCDLGVQFKEELKKDTIHFVPTIEKVGKLFLFFGHKEIEGGKRPLIVNKGKKKIRPGVKVHVLYLGTEKIMLKFGKY